MKTKQNKNFQTYLEELENWMYGNAWNGGMEFAFRNGFHLHAVSLWLSSGASSLDLPLKIDRTKEKREVKKLLSFADIFECPSCNHYSFFYPGEIDEDTTQCESCLKTMHLKSRGTK